MRHGMNSRVRNAAVILFWGHVSGVKKGLDVELEIGGIGRNRTERGVTVQVKRGRVSPVERAWNCPARRIGPERRKRPQIEPEKIGIEFLPGVSGHLH